MDKKLIEKITSEILMSLPVGEENGE